MCHSWGFLSEKSRGGLEAVGTECGVIVGLCGVRGVGTEMGSHMQENVQGIVSAQGQSTSGLI